jgi:predicted GNAT family N-acyltransferase
LCLSLYFITIRHSCNNARFSVLTYFLLTRTITSFIDTDRIQLNYRLRTCGELCSVPSIDSTDTDRKRLLLAHIIATKSASRLVTDAAMDFPKDWQTKYHLSPSVGHDELGDTVCIHSLCVHPDLAGRGLGRILLKSYVQRIKDSGVAKRVALICRDRLVGYYEKAGFSKVGPSKCQYGGGNWVDMVLEFEQGMGDEDDAY